MKRIGLDIGHAHNTQGKRVIKADGKLFKEFDFNLALGIELKKLLTNDGRFVTFEAQPLNNTTNEVSLKDRVDYYNRNACDVVISLHANAAASKSVKGYECFYWHTSQQGQRLANLWIRNAIELLPETVNRGVKACVPDTWSNFYIVRETKGVCILPEHAFFTNDMDVKLLESPDFIKRCALTSYRALCGFFGYEPKLSVNQYDEWLKKTGYEVMSKEQLQRELYRIIKGEDTPMGYSKIRFQHDSYFTNVHIYKSNHPPVYVVGTPRVYEPLNKIASLYPGAKCAVNANLFPFSEQSKTPYGYGLVVTNNATGKAVADYYQNSSPNFVDMIAYKDGNVKIEVVPDHTVNTKRLIDMQGSAHFGGSGSYALKIDGRDSKLLWNKFPHVHSHTDRTMIGNDKEGNWYLIVAEASTSSKGLRGTDQLKLLNQLNITNAINLDGGGSSAMMVNNQFVTTKKGRNIPTAFIFR